MAGPFDFTGQNIENTYQRVLQTPDGVNIYDGTGSLFYLGVFNNTSTGSFGSFYDTGSQTAVSATEIYSMSLSTTDISNGVYVDPTDITRVYVNNPGVYNIQFSAQFRNTGNDPTDVSIWLRKNDMSSANDLADSSGIVTVPAKKGSTPGQMVTSWNYYVTLATNDFVQFLWHAHAANVISLETIAAGTNPTHPRTPSLIVTAQRVDTFFSNTGSFSGSFTGSLLGTASWADSASQALTASFYQETDPIFTAKSASLATTGSNSFDGNQIITGSLTITGSAVIDISSSSEAFRITQRGGGFALVVEDDANPDSTSFVVDSAGRVGIGYGIGTPLGQNLSVNGVGAASTSFIAPTLQGTTLYPNNDVNLNIRTRDSGLGDKNIIFGTGNSGSVPYTRMVISASGDVYISSGSLGVGTVNPKTKLHIISGSSSGANVQSSDTAVFESNNHTNVSILSPTGQNSSLQFGSAGDILGAYVKWNQDNNLMTLGTANDGDNISFVTGNETSSMYLKNNTGLGIGTTAPLYRLHVRNGEVTPSSTFAGSVGVFENSGSNTFISILSHNAFSSAVGFGSNISRSAARLLWNHDSQNFNLATNIPSAFLTFGTGNETERMRITSGGLVGIGTTAPQYLLDVSGSARVTSSLYLPGLTSSPEVNVVLINTSSGQLYYTASSAIGGGGGGGPTAWGTITGDITAQSDLNTILAALETIKNFAGSFPG